MKKINLLFVEENRDGTVGGSHFLLLDLIGQLDKKKFGVFVAFYCKNKIITRFKNSSDEVLIIPKPHGINLVGGIGDKGLFYRIVKIVQAFCNFLFVSLIPFVRFVLVLQQKKIDIVQLNDTVFSGFEWVFAAKMTGRKIIAHERGIHVNPPRQLFFSPSYHTRFFNYILGMSESTRRNMEELGVDLHNRYSTFYDRIDVDSFVRRVRRSGEDVRREFGIDPGTPAIGIVGNIKRWKGQLVVVDAVHLLHARGVGLHCLIIGDVSRKLTDDVNYSEEIVSGIKEYGLSGHITLTGHRTDVPDIMNALDIVLHASTLPEPFGMVILEGMALGKPVIASAIGGPLEIIENNKSGILCEPDNPTLLANCIEELIKNNDMKTRIGLEARKRIDEKFSKFNARFLENLYMKLSG